MDLQKVQLDGISKWLFEMEDKLSHLPALGPNLDALKKQVEKHKVYIDINTFSLLQL